VTIYKGNDMTTLETYEKPLDILPQQAVIREMALPPLGDLAGALAVAQAKARSAAKDATNKFHGYDYASAESVMSVAKVALEGVGLAVIPLGHRLCVKGTGQAVMYEIEQQFMVAHKSGQTLTFPYPWPVIPERGRPLDKAMAGALTTSLSYFLRGLLQIPRVEEDEVHMDGRDDRDAAPPAPPVKPAPLPAKQADKPLAPSPWDHPRWKALYAKLTACGLLNGQSPEDEAAALITQGLKLGDDATPSGFTDPQWERAEKLVDGRLARLRAEAGQ
jgi:hypothetical protein